LQGADTAVFEGGSRGVCGSRWRSGLHISLGIFYRLFTLLETECHKLDLLLAAQIGSDEVTAGPSFEDHVALIHERQLLLERMEGLEANLQEFNSLTTWLSVNLPDAETNPHLANLFKEADKLR